MTEILCCVDGHSISESKSENSLGSNCFVVIAVAVLFIHKTSADRKEENRNEGNKDK